MEDHRHGCRRHHYHGHEMRMLDSEGSPSPRKGPDDGSARYSPSRAQYATEAHDMRPQGEYDEPWEWPLNQNLIRQQMEESANQNKTPLMTPKRTSAPAGAQAVTGAGESEAGGPGGAKSHSEAPGASPAEGTANVDTGQAKAEAEEDDEGAYTHLNQELSEQIPPPPATATTDNPDVRPKDRTGNYDEPWDLTHTRNQLEEKLLAAAKTKDSPDKKAATTAAPTAPPTAAPKPGQTPPHVSDTRPQEGYEKPWDWKPDKRDDRPQEGYEKPWDWKPEKRDERPHEEYEEPWDQKGRQIEMDLINAKSAKEALVAGREGAAVPNANGIMGPVLGKQCEDMRPGDEYDEPWDQKLKKMALTRTGSDSSTKSSPSPVLPGHVRSPQGQSPKKGKDGLQAVPEKINPLLPLSEQGWYHGSISRQSAESLLRVSKEGSYLVRLSESNKLDYSLSLKSARGFMHMKITSRDGRYILGQFSQPFDNIPMMIHHYSVSKLPIKGQEHMSLLHPIIHELL